MRYILMLLIGCMLAGCTPQKQPTENQSNKVLSDQKSAEVLQAEVLGKAIFEQDTVAAKATDALLAETKTVTSQDISGWIVVSSAQGYLVRFILEKDTELKPVYDVRINSTGKGTVSSNDLKPLSSEEEAMFLARQSALKVPRLDCSDRYNTVVLKEPDSNDWLVYVLAATTKDEIVVGGHSRVRVSADGRSIVSVTPLSKSCLTMTKPKSEKSMNPFGLSVTHIVGDTPSEIHVYLNYLHRYDLYVGTSKGMWLVKNGKISFLGNLRSTALPETPSSIAR
jgi:hypothetical protein